MIDPPHPRPWKQAAQIWGDCRTEVTKMTRKAGWYAFAHGQFPGVDSVTPLTKLQSPQSLLWLQMFAFAPLVYYHCWPPPYAQPQSRSGSVWVIVNTSNHFTERPTRGNHQWERKLAYYKYWPPHTLCLFTNFARKFPPDSLIYNLLWAAKSPPNRLLLLLLLCSPLTAFSWSIKQKCSDQAKVWPTSGTNNLPITHQLHLAIGNNNVGSQVIIAGKLEEEIYEFQSKCLACCITRKTELLKIRNREL